MTQAIDDTLLRPGTSIDAIVSVVSASYGVDAWQIRGHRRFKSLVLPRHVAMYLARKLTKHSLEDIARAFNHRDHTTIIHAVHSIKAKMESCRESRRFIEILEAEILGDVMPVAIESNSPAGCSREPGAGANVPSRLVLTGTGPGF